MQAAGKFLLHALVTIVNAHLIRPEKRVFCGVHPATANRFVEINQFLWLLTIH